MTTRYARRKMEQYHMGADGALRNSALRIGPLTFISRGIMTRSVLLSVVADDFFQQDVDRQWAVFSMSDL